MIAGNETLVLVDVQNVYYGARNYSAGSAIDYGKLIEVVTTEVTVKLKAAVTQAHGEFAGELCTPTFDVYGYVVKTPKYDGIKLFTLLRKLGYRLRYRQFPESLDPESYWKGSVGAMMQMDYVDWCPQYAHVVVVSGSGIFAPVFKASKRNWPRITRTLVAWENTLHSAYEDDEDLTDNIIYLDDSVLR
jgi:uncharacterized LabA/DUF88 family protein